MFFNRSYYPDFGATGQLLTELCEDLVARFGYDVTVVAGMPLAAEQPIAPIALVSRRCDARSANGVHILRAWSTSQPHAEIHGPAGELPELFLVRGGRVASASADRMSIVSLTDPPIVSLTAIAAATATGARFVFLCQDVFPEVARLLEDFQNEKVEALLTQDRPIHRRNAPIASSRSATR